MNKMKWVQLLPKEAIYDEINSPVGQLTIVTSSQGIHAVLWDMDRTSERCSAVINNLNKFTSDTMQQVKKQLTEYFHGKRKIFDLPLVLQGTDFQIQAWKELLKIPYAKTFSYGQQAEKVGNKNKARAVGLANGQNPISIIVPCHRVIGSNGHLVGFGGGIEKKDYLLKLEQKWNSSDNASSKLQ